MVEDKNIFNLSFRLERQIKHFDDEEYDETWHDVEHIEEEMQPVKSWLEGLDYVVTMKVEKETQPFNNPWESLRICLN